MEKEDEEEEEDSISIPFDSFTAFRFLYGDSNEISLTAKSTLLGSIPNLWFKERRNTGLLNKLSSVGYSNVIKSIKKHDLVSLTSNNIDKHTRKFMDSIFNHDEEEENDHLEYDDDMDYETESDDDKLNENFILKSNSTNHEPAAESVIKEEVLVEQQQPLKIPNISLKDEDTVDSFVTAPEEIIDEAEDTVQFPNNLQVPVLTKTQSKPTSILTTQDSISTISTTVPPPRVKFTRFQTGSVSRSRISSLKPNPESEDDNISLIMPLDRSHKDSFKKIKRSASRTKVKLTNETIKNQKRIYQRIRSYYSIGEIIKMEKMLVMIKSIQSNSTFNEFTELEPCDTRVMERWKEYILVARSSDDIDNPVLIQLYTKRQIPNKTNKKFIESEFEFALNKNCIINLYSALDKSISIVHNDRIYILNCQTSSSSIKWFSFLNQTLGKIKSSNDFKLEIPQMKMSIDLKLSMEIYKLIEKNQDVLNLKFKPIGYVRESRPIIAYLLNKLSVKLDQSGFSEVSKGLKSNQYLLGLCWRYYDRLEWLFGENLQNMFWQQSMNKTYSLELRTIQQYPLSVDGLIEPTPIEGFLSRFTSNSGDLKKGLFRSQVFHFNYIFTSNNLLFFTHAYKALPPIQYEGFSLDKDLNILKFQNFYKNLNKSNSFPIIYENNPYPIDSNSHITWLNKELSPEEFAKRDKFAMIEFERKIALILRSDGVLNLAEIKEISSFNPEKIPIGAEMRNFFAWNSNIDKNFIFNTKELLQLRSDCYFKIIMKNGVTIIFRAPTPEIKREWIRRLIELRDYWKLRIEKDLLKLKSTKLFNIKKLRIDEYSDSNSSISTLNRWESLHALADPEIHNISPNSMFRTIIKSGYIYQKPKKHSSFRNLFIVLIPGFLKLFKVFKKNFAGKTNSTIFHQHYMTIPISDSYIYSGNICELDLIEHNTYDLNNSNDPERQALPRVYDDGWVSSDDELSRCFTLWFGKKRAIAGGHHNEDDETIHKNPGLIRMASRLGVTGKSMVFMCRSRQEKELWVNCLNVMLERYGNNIE